MGARKNENGLTAKQEAWAAEYIRNGGNATQAAIKAYPNATLASAQQIGWENLNKLELSKELRKEFARQGVTLEKAIKPVVKGLEAKDREGNDDLDKQMRAHDRFMKAINMGDDNGLSLNIESAKGIEITFKNLGGQNAESIAADDAEDA